MECSLDFALTAFSEVRYPQATPSYGKDTLFGRYALPWIGRIMIEMERVNPLQAEGTQKEMMPSIYARL
jgi:hypothetical protein